MAKKLVAGVNARYALVRGMVELVPESQASLRRTNAPVHELYFTVYAVRDRVTVMVPACVARTLGWKTGDRYRVFYHKGEGTVAIVPAMAGAYVMGGHKGGQTLRLTGIGPALRACGLARQCRVGVVEQAGCVVIDAALAEDFVRYTKRAKGGRDTEQEQ